MAGEDGLLAIGGDLSTKRLLLAYSNGIFPWFNEDEPICWWSPNPRFVLFPDELKIHRSMHQVLRSGSFQFTVNRDFSAVIRNCMNMHRKGQGGTWISPVMLDAYTRLYEEGHAHSAEAWMDHKLVGGLYGIRIGRIFFGESMFSKVGNASKFTFIRFVKQLQQEGVRVIDCQVYTSHLESLGARMIPREAFSTLLRENIGA